MKQTYVVVRRNRSGTFTVVAEVARRAGLTAKVGRRDAIIRAIGREPRAGEVYAAIARSEWRIGFEY